MFENERRKGTFSSMDMYFNVTDWDSNRECLKIDKVVKHSSSTEIIAANNYIINASHQENALSASHIKIHHTIAYKIL